MNLEPRAAEAGGGSAAGGFASYAVAPSPLVQVSLTGLQPLTRYVVDQFLAYVRSMGIQVTVTSAKRSFWEQTKLWRDWILGRSKFPANRPGTSTHEFGRAVDLVFSYQGQRVSGQELSEAGMKELAAFFYLRWLGTRDPVHFELDCKALAEQFPRSFPSECLEPIREV